MARVSDTLRQMRSLVAAGEVRISEHGYDELADDGLTVGEIVDGLLETVVIEDYPDFPKGPCVLVLQRDRSGDPVHAVWGIPKDAASPAVLVTAYRPDPDRWDDSFTRRRK
jgi:hypothetical protein